MLDVLGCDLDEECQTSSASPLLSRRERFKIKHDQQLGSNMVPLLTQRQARSRCASANAPLSGFASPGPRAALRARRWPLGALSRGGLQAWSRRELLDRPASGRAMSQATRPTSTEGDYRSAAFCRGFEQARAKRRVRCLQRLVGLPQTRQAVRPTSPHSAIITRCGRMAS